MVFSQYFINKINYAYMLNYNDFYMVIIKNNKVKCNNSEIKQQIKSKLSTLNITIKNVTFFTTLTKKHFPSYYINDDLKLFLKEFTKIHKYINIQNTLAFTTRKLKTIEPYPITYNITNQRFNTNYLYNTLQTYKFNQIIYHAGDMRDFEKYGLLGLNNDIDKNSIIATYNYMNDNFKKGVFVVIKNNKLEVYLPFSNSKYINNFFHELYFDKTDKQLLNKLKLNPYDKQLIKQSIETCKHYLKKYKLKTTDKNFDRRQWIANNYMFKYDTYEGDQNVALYHNMMTELSKYLTNGIFFLNLRDSPIVSATNKHPYTDLTTDELKKPKNLLNIFSVCSSNNHLDIPMPTQDDWHQVVECRFPDDFNNSYLTDDKLSIHDSDYIVPWNNKIEKLFFRGTATGNYSDNRNIRIHAKSIGENSVNMDIDITKWNRKLKKTLNNPLYVSNFKDPGTFITNKEKRRYKYILVLDGHVAAFRLSNELSYGSVVLMVSKFNLWYNLTEGVEYIGIKEDLSDLKQKVLWCIKNDDKCKIIADNAKAWYKLNINKKNILKTFAKSIEQHTPISIKQHTSVSMSMYVSVNLPKIAIITLYRDNKTHTRFEQLKAFQYYMKIITHNKYDADIYIIEQSKNDPFNIGKLKNIGYDLAKKSKTTYSNYIFMDIDTLPDTYISTLLNYKTDGVVSLAVFGTRYETIDSKDDRVFLGAMIGVTGSVFEEINGFSNSFWGWGGEDINLILRLIDKGKNISVVDRGSIIDLEEINGKVVHVKDKIIDNKSDDSEWYYEKNYNYKDTIDIDGLNNLDYDITEYIDNVDNVHVIVDLKYDEYRKMTHLYDYETISKETYKNKMKILSTISVLKIP